jgi:eukaryotic-like serine/threonine-protein kinase
MSDPPEPSKSAGGSLGKYRLLTELGRGGMATVHLAIAHGPAGFNTGFNKLVVIKQICSQFSEENQLVAMFLDEARLAGRLNHPNVVQTNEIGEQDGRYYIAMEYLEGQPLNRILRRMASSGGMPLAMHLRVIADALAGLHYAHELADYDGTPLGIVHRDVNPQNVFVTYDGTVKVVDFGIAKAKSSIERTQVGVLKGKIMYMAPEQATAESVVDRRADIFSAGVMLWEAVTGKRPWVGVSDLDVLRRLKKGLLPRVRSIQPDVPERLEAIIERAVACEPRDRYATAADLQADLDAYLEGLSEHVHMREAGALIMRLFASELSQIRHVIDVQIRADFTEGLDSAGPLPVIDLPSIADKPNDAGEAPPDVTPSAEASSVPSLTPETSSSPHKQQMRLRRLARRAPHLSFPSPPLVASITGSLDTTKRDQPTGQLHPAPRRRWVRAVTAGGLLLVVLLALGVERRRNGTPALALANVQTSVPSVRLEVSAWPAEATLSLDGRSLPGNPFHERLPWNETVHSLRIEAPGYATRTEELAFDRDRIIDVTLAAAPAGSEYLPGALDGGSSPHERVPGARHFGPSQGSPSDGKGPRGHALDNHNPYDE